MFAEPAMSPGPAAKPGRALAQLRPATGLRASGCNDSEGVRMEAGTDLHSWTSVRDRELREVQRVDIPLPFAGFEALNKDLRQVRSSTGQSAIRLDGLPT